MAFSSWRTWSTGEVVTAAHMNQDVRDNGEALFPDEAAAVSWSPDIEGTSSGSITGSGRRYRIGPLQFVWARFVFSTTGLPNGTYFVTLPVAYSGIASGTVVGEWRAQDDTTSANNETGAVFVSLDGSSDTVRFGLPVGNVVNSDSPFTWTNDDVLTFHAIYPVA